MPNLMESFVSGSNAVKQYQENVAIMPHIQELAALKVKDATLDTEAKTLNVNKLQEAARTDSEFKSTLNSYYSKPENQDKPPSEAMYELSKIAMAKDPKLGERFLETAGKMTKQEGDSLAQKEAVAKSKLDNMTRIVQTMDPEKPEDIQKLIMAQNIGGFNSDLYQKEVNSMGPVQAKENFLNRIKTEQQRHQEQTEAAALLRLENENKKIDLQNNKFDALTAKWDRESQSKVSGADAKEQKVVDKLYGALRTEFKSAHDTYLKQWNKAHTDEDRDGMELATQEYYSKVDTINANYAPRFAEKDVDFQPYIVADKSTPAPVNNTTELGAGQFEIKAAKDFTPTSDQTATLQNAMKALEQGADRAKVITLLKKQGIKLGE